MGENNKQKKDNQKKKKMKLKINKSPAQASEKTTKTITDERFVSAETDPRFMEAPRKRSKVFIDSRFHRVFTDKSFVTSSAPVDKRGKPKNKAAAAASSSLKHYYRQQQQDEEEDKEKEENEKEEDVDSDNDAEGYEIDLHSDSESEESTNEEDDSEQGLDESESTSSDTDSDDDEYVDLDDGEEDTFMQQEDNVPEIDKETRRLAVVNLDWSQVRAVDLYAVLSSFLPKGGQIMSVAVYPSEFGLKRMEEEAVNGPVGLFDEEEEKEHDDEDEDEIDNKKLRAYELSRLSFARRFDSCEMKRYFNLNT